MRITHKIDFDYGLPCKIEQIGKTPNVSKMMALVLFYQRLLDKKVISSLMDISRLEKISSNRVSSIMSLSLLSPRIQERLLTLPREYKHSKQISVLQCVNIAYEIDFEKQMEMFEKLV